MNLSAGSIIAGKFRLVRPLAHGGMGSVWVAFNTQLEVPIALKFMGPALVGSPDLVARFEREAKSAAQLRNPHVVQIFEYGVDHGAPYIAMELLEGEDLGARLRSRGRLSLQETSRVLGDVCKALRRAHDMGLIHRDLKPANIFLGKHDEYEVVKVLDFGVAKWLASSDQADTTQTGAIVGSPNYMAPEQARRSQKQIDHRADLWAVGVLAFRCLTGRLPFQGETVMDVLVRVCTCSAPAPSTIAPDLGPEVDRFFARALAHSPEARFQSAREMAVALAFLSGQEAPSSLDRSWSDVRMPPPPPSGSQGPRVLPPPPPPSPLPRAAPISEPRVVLQAPAPAAPTHGAQAAPLPRGGSPDDRAPLSRPALRLALSGTMRMDPRPSPDGPAPSTLARPSPAAGPREPSDDATTIPISDPKAQRSIEGRPWAAASQPAASSQLLATGEHPGTVLVPRTTVRMEPEARPGFGQVAEPPADLRSPSSASFPDLTYYHPPRKAEATPRSPTRAPRCLTGRQSPTNRGSRSPRASRWWSCSAPSRPCSRADRATAARGAARPSALRSDRQKVR